MRYILTILTIFSSLFCVSQGIRATMYQYHDTIKPEIVISTKNEAFIKDLDKSFEKNNFRGILKYLEVTIYVNTLSSETMSKTENTEIVRFLNTLVPSLLYYKHRISFIPEDLLNIYKLDIGYFEYDKTKDDLIPALKTYYFVEMHGKIVGFHAP